MAMGLYVNPGNLAFRRIVEKDYVDKTNLIKVMNERVGWKESLLCISRPRRFGKSYAAMMLTAYYDCSCDSHDLFADKRIAESENYEEHINQYNVICLDVSGFISEAKRLQKSLEIVPVWMVDAIMNECDMFLLNAEKYEEMIPIFQELLEMRDLSDDQLTRDNYISAIGEAYDSLGRKEERDRIFEEQLSQGRNDYLAAKYAAILLEADELDKAEKLMADYTDSKDELMLYQFEYLKRKKESKA